jgi:hypothetical protein
MTIFSPSVIIGKSSPMFRFILLAILLGRLRIIGGAGSLGLAVLAALIL